MVLLLKRPLFFYGLKKDANEATVIDDTLRLRVEFSGYPGSVTLKVPVVDGKPVAELHLTQLDLIKIVKFIRGSS